MTASDDKALNSNEQTEESSDLLSAKTESNTVEQEEPQAAHAQHGSVTDGSATTADHQVHVVLYVWLISSYFLFTVSL